VVEYWFLTNTLTLHYSIIANKEGDNMARVEIRGISKLFGEVKAVDQVDLETAEGEFLVLLGPSGCGKTTLLRMIAGIEEPSAGDILIEGQVVTHLPPRMRNIAMVFQSYALYPHMSVYRNIAFPLRTRGVEKGAIKEKVKWAADMFGIGRLLERKPRELSGGERQRVALARAMVREPSVFLLDEPLSNLDALLRASAREELRQFQKRVGVTTIYVTHDQVEAMGLGDRIVVMSKGKIRQVGTPRDIYQWPADTFVATFVGSPPMNLIGEEDILIGFRPETFMPADFIKAEEGVVTYPFEVTWLEYLGAERLVYGNVGEKSHARHVVSRLPGNVTLPIEAGQTYPFAIARSDIRFFNRVSGQRTDQGPA
jgi:multiple sugar transport system ATP-binding protein